MFNRGPGPGGRNWQQNWGPWGNQMGRMWERRERVFGRGDLKFVILDLLKDQPRHGYDIIREIESRFEGFYTPSAGSVYPILQLLEDMGAVTAVEQEGRKVYTITDEGRRILAERQDTVNAISGRMRDWFRGRNGSEIREVMREAAELGATIAWLAGREDRRILDDPPRLRRIRDLLARTRDELRDILREEPTV